MTQDDKANSTLTQQSRTGVMSLSQDSKFSGYGGIITAALLLPLFLSVTSGNTMTADSRTAVGALSQESKTTGGYLWSDTIYPWQLDYPWLWENNGSVIISDLRT